MPLSAPKLFVWWRWNVVQST